MSRNYCAVCYRPQRACICHLVEPIANAIPLRIIQHSGEVTQAKDTAKLAALCLTCCEIEVVDHQLQQWTLAEHEFILFPDDSATAIEQVIEPVLSGDLSMCRQPIGFVLLDGTWRQANQLLRACKTNLNDRFVSLGEHLSETEYDILRKTKKNGALSTIEAISEVIRFNHEASRGQLLTVFQSFIQFQLRFKQ